LSPELYCPFTELIIGIMKFIAIFVLVLVATEAYTEPVDAKCIEALEQIRRSFSGINDQYTALGEKYIKELEALDGIACTTLARRILKNTYGLRLQSEDAVVVKIIMDPSGNILSPFCTAALKSGVQTIIKIKGAFSGGLNKDAIMRELAAIGVSSANIVAACK
jgi:hypothetical protein